MKKQAGATRDRIIAAALELFSRQGYGATSIAEILERAQANSSSLYYSFKTKDALLLHALERHILRFESMVERRTAKVADPIEQVFCILDFYRRSLLATNYACGCFIGKLTLEISPDQPHLRRVLADALDRLASVVEARLKKAAGRFPMNTNFQALSRFILAVIEGGVMQSRAANTIDSFDAAVSHLQDYFSWLICGSKERSSVEQGLAAPDNCQSGMRIDALSILPDSAGQAACDPGIVVKCECGD